MNRGIGLLLGLLPLAGGMLAGSVAADPADLSDGVLIVHDVPELAYTSDYPTGGWCMAVDGYAIGSCAQQNTRIDVTDIQPATWFVLAAWEEEKEWCAVEFGFGAYDTLLFTFDGCGPCYPYGQGFEIASADWPGPEEGTMFVCYPDQQWTGNFVPVYWFGGYAYGGANPGVIPLVEDAYAGSGEPFGGFVNCSGDSTYKYELSEGDYGALGINTDGIAVCPDTREHPCCVGGGCYLATADQCESLGGTWHMEWDSCSPNPCAVSDAAQDETAGANHLLAPQPNPFTGATRLRYCLAEAGPVEIAIYDAGGRRVRRLLAETCPAGGGAVTWDGRDAAGNPVARGAYFGRMTVGDLTTAQRIILAQ